MSLPPELSALPPSERTILRLKALIGAATGKTLFMDCLNRLGLTSPAWTTKTLNPVLEDLRKRRLLNDAFACAAEFQHPQAVEALASPQGAAMVSALRAVMPQDKGRNWDWRAMEAETLRWQRLSVLLNDEDGYRHATEFHKRRTHRDAPSVFAGHFAMIEVGAEWLASRTPAFRAAILVAKADLWMATGHAEPGYAGLMDLCRRDPALLTAAFPLVADFDALSGALSRLTQTVAAAPDDLQADMPVPLPPPMPCCRAMSPRRCRCSRRR